MLFYSHGVNIVGTVVITMAEKLRFKAKTMATDDSDGSGGGGGSYADICYLCISMLQIQIDVSAIDF